MKVNEKIISFSCEEELLVGILHQPEKPTGVAVLIVVGGPQYRIGSHRQFVILARFLAQQGVSVFRFDYRGMGDSSGFVQDFEQVGPDIKAAVDVFYNQHLGIKKLFLWGLCDAASAISFYASEDKRVEGLVLLNPWVRTEKGENRAFLKNYYLKRIFSRGLWQKVLSGELNLRASLVSLAQKFKGAFKKPLVEEASEELLPLPDRVLNSLSGFNKPLLFILSGRDLTAQEFIQLVASDARGKKLMRSDNVSRIDLSDSDHTFSNDAWREQVNTITWEWVKDV